MEKFLYLFMSSYNCCHISKIFPFSARSLLSHKISLSSEIIDMEDNEVHVKIPIGNIKALLS